MRSELVLRIAVMGVSLLALAACDSLREEAGLTKQSPDEFAVTTKAPLVVPPDFNLRPPSPGAAPGEGGRRLKSGGMIKGALVVTANSSGDCLVRPASSRSELQAASAARLAPRIVKRRTRMDRIGLLQSLRPRVEA